MVFADFTVKIIDVTSGASSLTPSLTILTVNLVGGKRSTWDMGGIVLMTWSGYLVKRKISLLQIITHPKRKMYHENGMCAESSLHDGCA